MQLKRSTMRSAFAALAAAVAMVAMLCTAGAAHAVTSAEKQAEADAVMQQIDVLQTSLNEANAELEQANQEYDTAVTKRDEAQSAIEEETEHIEELQESLAACATGMYKTGGSASFVEVLLGASTFQDFLTSWDAINSISGQGAHLVQQSKDAREAQENAKAEYEAQSQAAEEHIARAEEAKKRIEDTQAALKAEAEKITKEVAELQAQEELAREAARLAAQAALDQESAAQAAVAAIQLNTIQGGSSSGSVGPAQGSGEIVDTGGGQLANPCPTATNSSGFGYRDFNGGSFHKGLDMAASEGTPYYAAESGTVIYATYDGGYNGGAGNWIVISHGNGLVTKYMHSSQVFVSVGQHVSRGEHIGAVGNTGDSYGAHLHFQVEINGVAVNPLNFI